MLSLEQAKEQQEEYRTRPEILAKLGSTTMIAMVGPIAAGKNFLMQASGLSVVGNETSRPPRIDDDPALYSYSTTEKMLEAVESQDFVQYGVFLPDYIYATRPEHYLLGEPNVKDIWHDAAHTLENKGFKAVKTVSVLTPGTQWLSQLMLRADGMRQDAVNSRLSEARRSIRWGVTKYLAGGANHLIVINDVDNIQANVKQIRRFATEETSTSLSYDQITNAAAEMYETINTAYNRLEPKS